MVDALKEDVNISGDTAYMLLCSVLVFFMNMPGLFLFYGGLVQAKHVLSVMMQGFGVTCVCALLWLCCGYSLSFSGSHPFIGNLDSAFLAPLQSNRNLMIDDIPLGVHFLFQGTFAIITPGLIIGVWVERAKFSAVLLFCGLWELLVYCPVCHWIWGGGWLQNMGMRDFAGGLVVHVTAGGAAIVAAKLLPPRPGFPNNCAEPHNLTMVMTGAAMLWVGWFGFNGGSALHASCAAAMASVTTAVSACVGTLVWLVIQGYRSKPTVEAAVTGMVAGLGSITPASGFVGVPGALVIGLVASCTCYAVTALVKERGLADDSLDVSTVHGIGGLVGTILTAPLSAKEIGGVGFDATVPVERLFGVQCLGCLATFAWSALWSALLIVCIDKAMGFCNSTKEQSVGLDITTHGGRAYATQEAHEQKMTEEKLCTDLTSEEESEVVC